MNIITFDLETDGLLDTVSRITCIGLSTRNGSTWSDPVTYHSETLEEGLHHVLNADVVIGHNILEFDLPVIQKLYGKAPRAHTILDTILLSRLVFPDITERDFAWLAERREQPQGKEWIGRHSLEAWGHRLGLLKGDYGKDPEAWKRGVTPELLTYCQQDVRITCALIDRLLGDPATPEAWKVAKTAVDLEHEFRRYINEQEANGFPFDYAAASALYAELAEKRAHLTAQLSAIFPPVVKSSTIVPRANNSRYGYRKGEATVKYKTVVFNPASHDHIAERLAELRGFTPTEFTETGKPCMDGDVLLSLYKQHGWEECKLLADFADVNKIIGMLAEGNQAWLKLAVQDATGVYRIHGKVTTNGAVTGRCTHSRPNLAQVPRTGDLGHRCRALFTAFPTEVLLGWDASGLELRMLASYLARYDGGAYIKTILTGDIHTTNQHAAGLETRDQAKRFIYAFLYGASGLKLSEVIGAPVDVGAVLSGASASEIRHVKESLKTRGIEATDANVAHELVGRAVKSRFMARTPGLRELKRDVEAVAKERGYLKGIDGRRLRIRSLHSALNTLLQSAGALAVKTATIIWRAETARSLFDTGRVRAVAHVHDEVQASCADVETATAAGDAAIQAVKLAGERRGIQCPLSAEYRIGKSWAETH